jgi:site-specific DNA-methyltransferase (adenine-specific)
MRSFHYTCTLCGKQKHQHDDTRCADPDYERVMHEPTQLRAYQEWCELWAVECLRVLKPGGYLLAFGGTRTHHRLACAVEDAGFEIRDSIAWLYGSGFPKSLDVSKAIDKAAGAEREASGERGNTQCSYLDRGETCPGHDDAGQSMSGATVHRILTAPATDDARRWSGWGTALKPAHEPIVVARKPLAGTVAANVLAHGTGGLNIDWCRVGWADYEQGPGMYGTPPGAGRWPPNVMFDEDAAAELDRQSGTLTSGRLDRSRVTAKNGEGWRFNHEKSGVYEADEGGASRFFPTFRYEPKAPADERPFCYRPTCECEDAWPTTSRARATAVTTAPGNGGSPAGSAASSSPSIASTGTSPAKAGPSTDGAAPAISPRWSATSVCGNCAAPTRRESHATVKPLDLMRWLVRLVTPPGGVVLDPFAGSGTTGEACIIEGFRCVLIEREADYLPLIRARLDKPIQMTLGGGVA